MKVKELIETLKEYNQEAQVSCGDSFESNIMISYGYSDGCKKENCEFVYLTEFNEISKENS